MELTRFPAVKALLKSRWLQLILLVTMLGGFLLVIFSGLMGTPVGNSNFGIVFVWIAWWAILILIAVPFFGRAWCAVCPIPLPGEWVQRGAILEPPQNKPHRLNRRWPKIFRNIWLQNLSFTLLALFSAVVLTTPKVTAIILAAMLFVAFGMSLIFERRSFCRFICPVGGFIGLYSQAAPLELRVKDKNLCLSCAEKPCYNGSAYGYGCPWQVFPGGLAKNTYCGLCMECLRSCPKDNISLNIRPFGADLAHPAHKLDEAFKAFIMLGSAVIYTGLLLGPWGSLKLAAYSIGSKAWIEYAGGFLAMIFLFLPGLFALAVKIGQWIQHNSMPIRKTFVGFATTLVPLGLAFWAAFSLSFVLINASYILSSLSNPFGWGWNLLGTAGLAWQPYLTNIQLPLQTLVLVAGLIWSIQASKRAGLELKTSAIPVAVFATLSTFLMLGLLV